MSQAGKDRDDYLDAVLIGGREERVIEIVDYRPTWVDRFEAERARIEAALGPLARRVEHIGSTAVPGLAAKPIVDIMVTVGDPDDEQLYGPELERVGYVIRVREAGHRMFRTPERDVHVHIWAAGGEDERRHLVFRDWLRSNADDRAEYERTKRTLAGRHRDMNDYADAKRELIEQLVERAGHEGARHS
ncbi:MAG: GrpB family protein [Acidimicrobiia bacterium]